MVHTGATQVKPPVPLPGSFYVLEYSKDSEVFTLYADDAVQSSYDLGSLTPARVYLTLFGGKDADLAMDHAMQFGAVQVIPQERRVLALFDRNPAPVDVFEKVQPDAHYLPALLR
jgi:hypothetical protein